MSHATFGAEYLEAVEVAPRFGGANRVSLCPSGWTAEDCESFIISRAGDFPFDGSYAPTAPSDVHI